MTHEDTVQRDLEAISRVPCGDEWALSDLEQGVLDRGWMAAMRLVDEYRKGSLAWRDMRNRVYIMSNEYAFRGVTPPGQ